MAKYDPLRDHLARTDADSVKLSFAEIERIIGVPLAPSALYDRTWWANTWHVSRVQAHAWMAAGYRVDKIDLGGESVTFAQG